MSLIAHRCPEVADMVVPVQTLELVLEVVAALEAKIEALNAPAAAAGTGAGLAR
jgi:hypothetical protein